VDFKKITNQKDGNQTDKHKKNGNQAVKQSHKGVAEDKCRPFCVLYKKTGSERSLVENEVLQSSRKELN